MKWIGRTLVLSLVHLLTFACGAGAGMDGSGAWEEPGASWDVAGGSAGRYDTAASADEGEPPAPEREEEFAPPSAGDRYVFVLNEAREQVVVLDAETLAIELVEVGLRPTVLATAPGHDVAVVINAGGGDLSIIHAEEGEVQVAHRPAVPGLNRVLAAPDGRHAVAWFDFAALLPGEPVGSLQSVVVARTVAGETEAVEVGTGFHPRAVHFAVDEDGQASAAWVVTEEGLTRIPLDGDLPDLGVLPSLPVTEDPYAEALEREVLVTPDGRYAVARTLGQSELSVVDLEDGAITTVPLSGEPTDVDLSPDGATVLVMFPAESRAAVADIADLLAEGPSALVHVELGGPAYGAAVVAPDGGSALLYTTVGELESLVRLDLDTGATSPIRLQKSVRAVAYGPLSERALVLHRNSGRTPNANMSLEDFVDASEAYSVVDVPAAVARLQITELAPGPFAFTPGGERLYILLPDPDMAAHAVADVDLATLMAPIHALPSPPESVQPVPAAGKVAVSQAHPTGRITFFDIATGESDTLTGFQLGGLID